MSHSADYKFSIVPADALFDKRLSHAQLRCLSLICYYGGQKKGGCWPSYETLAANMKIERRNVIKYVKALCTLGYLTKETRHHGDGAQTSNVYRVNFDLEIDLSPSLGGVKKDHPPHDVGDHSGGVKKDHPLEQENLTGKKNNKKSIKKSLEVWEKETGSVLCIEQMASWCKEKRLDKVKVKDLIEEFRAVMKSNGGMYADYVATFQNYLRRGYLSMTLQQATLPPVAEVVPRFETYDRGSAL